MCRRRRRPPHLPRSGGLAPHAPEAEVLPSGEAAAMAPAGPSSGRRSLSSLPDSLLLQILAHLPPRDRMRGARVCRRWHCLVKDKFLWRHLDLTSYKMSPKVLWHLLRNHLQGNLRTLKARGSLYSARKQEVFTSAWMRALGKQCPGLHCLCLTETDLRSLPYDCIPSSVTTLELSSCEIPSGWFQVPKVSLPQQTFPKIQHLLLRNVPAFSDQHLFHLSTQDSLKSLVLSETYRVSDVGIKVAAPHLGNLECLTLRDCSISDSALHFIGRYLKGLRSLDLGGCSSLTDAGLLCLSSLSLLEDVSLASYKRLSPGAILAFCQALPQLRHLDLGQIDEKEAHNIQAGLPSCTVANTITRISSRAK